MPTRKPERTTRITQEELELFLLAQRRATEALAHLDAIRERLTTKFVTGAAVEPGVHTFRLRGAVQ